MFEPSDCLRAESDRSRELALGDLAIDFGFRRCDLGAGRLQLERTQKRPPALGGLWITWYVMCRTLKLLPFPLRSVKCPLSIFANLSSTRGASRWHRPDDRPLQSCP